MVTNTPRRPSRPGVASPPTPSTGSSLLSRSVLSRSLSFAFGGGGVWFQGLLQLFIRCPQLRERALRISQKDRAMPAS
jgi:hypothetical protein